MEKSLILQYSIVGMSVFGLWAVGTVRCRGKGLLNSPFSLSPLLTVSFFLPQDDINETTDETQREGHPGQHVGVAEPGATIIRAHHGVNYRPAHHEHT